MLDQGYQTKKKAVSKEIEFVSAEATLETVKIERFA